MKEVRLCIKVCPNPHCEAVFHNIPKNVTKCEDCETNIMEINSETFFKKFANNWFQYDYQKRNENGYLQIHHIQPTMQQLQFNF